MKKKMRQLGLLLLCFPLLFMACKSKTGYQKITHDPMLYNQMQHELNYVIIYDIFTPPVASRVFAYANLAAYEVLAKEGKHFETLEGKIKDLDSIPAPTAEEKKAIDYPFAATIAFMKVGKELTFSQDKMQHITDSLLDVIKQSGIPNDVYNNSIQYATAVANAIISWSKKDNYAQTRGARFTVTNLEGHWEPTPPGYFDAVEPKWMTIRTLVMDSVTQIKAPGPISFSKQPGSPFYKMVQQTQEMVNHLDTNQKWIANFWDCNSFKLHVQGHLMFATKAMTPCGHWMEIAGTIAKNKNADFYKTVYTYTGVSLGIFDAFIASWYAKYTYDLVRPETYINKYIDP
ncbi:MAG: phosphoesterase PA-phosphatase, partial [Bacteroidota bacterium]|nr:phosphoesterase PA-phosphatase [Bacteroidota bacterium]